MYGYINRFLCVFILTRFIASSISSLECWAKNSAEVTSGRAHMVDFAQLCGLGGQCGNKPKTNNISNEL